jgi:hypothetical protein
VSRSGVVESRVVGDKSTSSASGDGSERGSVPWGRRWEARRSRGISRMLSLRPASKSSSKDKAESGGDGRVTISCAVGSSTGNGAGGLVIEIVGTVGRDPLFDDAGVDPGSSTPSPSDTSVRTGMGISAEPWLVRSNTPRPVGLCTCRKDENRHHNI